MTAVPVCILGVIDYDWGTIESNRETYDESTLCPKGVARRVHDARLHRCECGAFHGPVPQWVLRTLGARPGPGLRLHTTAPPAGRRGARRGAKWGRSLSG